MDSLTIILFAIYIPLLVLVFRMARRRGRNEALWVAISAVFISPVIGAIVLLVLGETDERKKEKIIQEEELRQSVRAKGLEK